MNNERDTHFAGFARLVIEEVYANGPQTIDVYEQIIAQRAYDLVKYACVDINNEQMLQGVRLHPNAMLRAVADLTEWPPEPPTKDDTR
jgi:hypothetical protein